MKRIAWVLVAALAAFLAGCQGPCSSITAVNAPPRAGAVDFTTIAAVGTSISAGFQSGGLVDHHQTHAFPAILAASLGKSVPVGGTGDFTFDACSPDGVPPLLALQSYVPTIISSTGRTPGAPTNLGQATDYHNLAVPGALMVDLVDSTLYTQDPNPVRGSGYSTVMFDITWRHRGLGIQELIRRNPTFITFEFGANEVLGAAVDGTAAEIFPTDQFAAALDGALNTLHAALPNAKLALLNVPDVTTIPFCTTFQPFTLDPQSGQPVPLVGPGGGALGAGDLVLLTALDSLAVGTGFPVGTVSYLTGAPGNGRPLLDAQVLSAGEVGSIETALGSMNAAIASEAATRAYVAPVDLNGLLATIATNGLRVGPTLYTSAFVTGGLFSLDGIHPNDLAHAVIANSVIDAVNAKFGERLPHVRLQDWGSANASALSPAGAQSGAPVRVDGLASRLRLLFPRARR